jgi:hypothetical protein
MGGHPLTIIIPPSPTKVAETYAQHPQQRLLQIMTHTISLDPKVVIYGSNVVLIQVYLEDTLLVGLYLMDCIVDN